MSGVDFTTISPSKINSRRRTPCVEGCCGPMEIVICVSSGRSMTSNCGGRVVAIWILVLVLGLRSLVFALVMKHSRLRLHAQSTKIKDLRPFFTSNCTARSRAAENLCVAHGLPNRRAEVFDEDQGGRRRLCPSNRRFRARASWQFAKHLSRSERAGRRHLREL